MRPSRTVDVTLYFDRVSCKRGGGEEGGKKIASNSKIASSRGENKLTPNVRFSSRVIARLNVRSSKRTIASNLHNNPSCSTCRAAPAYFKHVIGLRIIKCDRAESVPFRSYTKRNLRRVTWREAAERFSFSCASECNAAANHRRESNETSTFSYVST